MAPGINNAAVEAICGAVYLKNYLDTTENLPEDIVRNTTQIRELDYKSQQLVNELENSLRQFEEIETDNVGRKKWYNTTYRLLINHQENLDCQNDLLVQTQELVDKYTRQLQNDLENLDPSFAEMESMKQSVVAPRSINKPANKHMKVGDDRNSLDARKRSKRQRIPDSQLKDIDDDRQIKKVKREVRKKQSKDDKSISSDIDPDEPRYCTCNQVSYGQMVGCDNDNCSIEWFHFDCMKLVTKPKGKWYCPDCRGDKSNIMRADLK